MAEVLERDSILVSISEFVTIMRYDQTNQIGYIYHDGSCRMRTYDYAFVEPQRDSKSWKPLSASLLSHILNRRDGDSDFQEQKEYGTYSKGEQDYRASYT